MLRYDVLKLFRLNLDLLVYVVLKLQQFAVDLGELLGNAV